MALHILACTTIWLSCIICYILKTIQKLTIHLWILKSPVHLWIFIYAGQVITGSWDKTIKCWDPRGVSGPERTLVGTYAQPERVYSLSLVGNRLVVATAGRHVNIYDLRNMSQHEQKRDSSLKYQTRCVRCFPNGTGNMLSFDYLCCRTVHFQLSPMFQTLAKCPYACDGQFDFAPNMSLISFFVTRAFDGVYMYYL